MTDIPLAYVASKQFRPEHAQQLRERIPGWGVDLDPADRPQVPRLQLHQDGTGAHWEFPDRQEKRGARERSIEHAFLTPVFGTAQPLKGLSGLIRRHAYTAYSEARAAHWLLLLLADRVDATEAHLRSLATRHPDNPVTETGIAAELSHHGRRSRYGRGRADTLHQPLDPIIVVGPWVAALGAAYVGARAVARHLGD